MRILLGLTLATTLAACGGGGTNEATDAGSNPALPAGNRVAALPEGARDAVFIRAIRDAGFDCQHVDSSVSVAPVRGLPAWRATCRGGGRWTILIAPEGTAQVIEGSAVEGRNGTAPSGKAARTE